jgi:hypothetical protein
LRELCKEGEEHFKSFHKKKPSKNNILQESPLFSTRVVPGGTWLRCHLETYSVEKKKKLPPKACGHLLLLRKLVNVAMETAIPLLYLVLPMRIVRYYGKLDQFSGKRFAEMSSMSILRKGTLLMVYIGGDYPCISCKGSSGKVVENLVQKNHSV